MDGNLRDSTYRVKLNSVRSLGPSQYVLVFSSAPPDPKRQPFFVRWFGALIPTKWWKNPQPVPNRLFPTVNQSQMSS